MGTHETELSKTKSDIERDRRVGAVIMHAHQSVWGGFSLSAGDEEHAQRFINGEIDLNDFVKPSSALEHTKA